MQWAHFKVTTWWCSSPSYSDLSSKAHLSLATVIWHHFCCKPKQKWEHFSILCWRKQPTWHLSASSCSFRSCTSCLESLKAPSWALLLCFCPSCPANGMGEAEVKQDEGLYPEAWLCDRLGRPAGLLVTHETGLCGAALELPLSKDIYKKTVKWYLRIREFWQKCRTMIWLGDQTVIIYTCLSGVCFICEWCILFSSSLMYSCSSWFFFSSCISACS